MMFEVSERIQQEIRFEGHGSPHKILTAICRRHEALGFMELSSIKLPDLRGERKGNCYYPTESGLALSLFVRIAIGIDDRRDWVAPSEMGAAKCFSDYHKEQTH
jgi:hypothetical protein